MEIYGQIIQDEKTTADFRNLHTELVNKIISFCKDHNIEADEFYLHADGLSESIKQGTWLPYTDSGFEVYKLDKSVPRNELTPLLFSI